jgi:hypothetical protein
MATTEYKFNSDVQLAQNSAVINPYALAELIAGRKITWKDIPDQPQVLEEILQTPLRCSPLSRQQKG